MGASKERAESEEGFDKKSCLEGDEVIFTRIRAVEWQIIAIGDKVINVYYTKPIKNSQHFYGFSMRAAKWRREQEEVIA